VSLQFEASSNNMKTGVAFLTILKGTWQRGRFSGGLAEIGSA
jgi:hypothetical protein